MLASSLVPAFVELALKGRQSCGSSSITASSGHRTSSADLQLGLLHTCNGDRLYLESCNIRDLSDTPLCMVAHPDRPKHNGFMATPPKRAGALKKLLPTCQQPSADEIAAPKPTTSGRTRSKPPTRRKPTTKTNAIEARAQAVINRQKPLTPEERAINRCITSGRLPASARATRFLGASVKACPRFLPAAGVMVLRPAPVCRRIHRCWQLAVSIHRRRRLSQLAPFVSRRTSLHHRFQKQSIVLNIDTSPKRLVLTLMP